MTKERLKQLKALTQEAEHLQEQIKNLPFRTGNYVADSAKDYRTGFPRTITIRGYSTEEYDKLKSKLEKKLRKIQEEIIEIENWLDGIDDPQTRVIFRRIYADGLPQEQVAEELDISTRTVQRKIERNVEQCR